MTSFSLPKKKHHLSNILNEEKKFYDLPEHQKVFDRDEWYYKYWMILQQSYKRDPILYIPTPKFFKDICPGYGDFMGITSSRSYLQYWKPHSHYSIYKFNRQERNLDSFFLLLEKQLLTYGRGAAKKRVPSTYIATQFCSTIVNSDRLDKGLLSSNLKTKGDIHLTDEINLLGFFYPPTGIILVTNEEDFFKVNEFLTSISTNYSQFYRCLEAVNDNRIAYEISLGVKTNVKRIKSYYEILNVYTPLRYYENPGGAYTTVSDFEILEFYRIQWMNCLNKVLQESKEKFFDDYSKQASFEDYKKRSCLDEITTYRLQ